MARHPERFLIVRIAALGDIAVASTLVNRIRAEHRGARITWLCGSDAAPLVELFGVDEIITVNERRLLAGSWWQRGAELARAFGALVRRRFDRVLLLNGDLRYLTLVAGAWPARIQRYADTRPNRFRGDEMAQVLDGQPHVGPIEGRYAMLDVRAALGPSRQPGSGGRRVALVPGGARNVLRDDALRRWPLERYRQLAEQLIHEGCEIVLIGSAGDAEAAAAFKALRVVDHIGNLSLRETLRVLAEVDVVVSHDTGPLHFARLVRRSVVALFGPTDPRHVLGEDDAITVLWGGARLPCRPCYDGRSYARCANNLCLRDVTVAEVREAVLGQLASRTELEVSTK